MIKTEKANEKDIEVGEDLIYVLPFSEYAEIKDILVCCAVVRVVEILSDKCCKCEFLSVISDNSGNGYYKYIQKSKGTANCSIKYLYRR